AAAAFALGPASRRPHHRAGLSFPLPGIGGVGGGRSPPRLVSILRHRTMTTRMLRVTINGTGFAADYTAACYGLIPHKNGVTIELAGVTSGRLERAEAFARARGVTRAYATHAEMLAAARPGIDNLCCANYAHGQYVRQSA